MEQNEIAFNGRPLSAPIDFRAKEPMRLHPWSKWTKGNQFEKKPGGSNYMSFAYTCIQAYGIRKNR